MMMVPVEANIPKIRQGGRKAFISQENGCCGKNLLLYFGEVGCIRRNLSGHLVPLFSDLLVVIICSGIYLVCCQSKRP